MANEKSEKRRFALTGVHRTMLAIVGALVLMTIVVNVLKACGLWLLRGEVYLFLPMLAAMVALGWGVYAIHGAINGKAMRMVITLLLGIVLFMAVIIGFSYISFLATVTVPQRYSTVVSPNSAHKVVVLRELDADETRIETRYAARLEADPESDPEVTAADWGYIYRGYTTALGVFYRPASLIEGEVYIGYASDAQLMVEWEDDETVAHFFVKDPGPADGGEMRTNAAYK